MPNAIFRKLAGLNSTKKVKDNNTLCFRVIVNGKWVTDYKPYVKGVSEQEAEKLGGKIDRTLIDLKRGY